MSTPEFTSGYSGVEATTSTTPERVYFDGVLMNTMAWNISTGSGRGQTPARRGEFMTVPNRSGSIPTFNRPVDAGTETWSMWVVGCTPEGLRPENETMRYIYDRNKQHLQWLFTDDSRLHDVEVHKLDGSIRTAKVAVVDTLDFSEMAGRTRGEFNVSLEIPDVYWTDQTPVTFSPQAITGASGTLREYDLHELRGGNGSIEDSVIKIYGPAQLPKLIDVHTGISVQYFSTLQNGQELAIESDSWGVYLDGEPILTSVSHQGHPRLFVISPRNGRSDLPRVRLQSNAMTADTHITVTARRKWWNS